MDDDDWAQLADLGDCGAVLQQHPLALITRDRVDQFLDNAIAWSIAMMEHHLLGIGPEPGPMPKP